MARADSFWGSVRESLRGTQQDFTQVAIPRAIGLLAVPMVLEMFMESLFGIVDIFFVARLGREGPAAVALTESLLTMVFIISEGLGMATTAFVARRIGEKDPRGAAHGAAQAILMAVAFSVVFGAAGALYAPQLLRLMGADPAVVAAGHSFTATMLGGAITILLLFLINAIFRGAGDAAIAMRVLWVANIINIVLDPCFIFGLGPFPEMGVAGAAVATNIGRGAGVIYQVLVLTRREGRIAITRDMLRPDFAVMLRILRVAFTGMLQFAVSMGSWLVVVRMMALFGSAALAGYSIAVRIIIFVLLPSWGMAMAAATLVGQNLGAGRPERAERAVWLTGIYNVVFLGAVAVVMAVFAHPMARLFMHDAEVVEVAAAGIRIVAAGNVCYAWGMVMVQAFNGAGDTLTPTVINVFCYWLFQLPFAWLLSMHLGMGPSGLFFAIPAAETLIAVVSVIMFRRGRWKKVRI